MGLGYIFYIHVFHLIIGQIMVWFKFMVFNATFNNISVISWWSVILVEEIRVPREVNDKLYLGKIMCYKSNILFLLQSLLSSIMKLI